MGFFCSPVSNEYLLAASHFGLWRIDVLYLCRRAVSAIFGGDEEKNRLWGLLDEFEQSELVRFSLRFLSPAPGYGYTYLFRPMIGLIMLLGRTVGV